MKVVYCIYIYNMCELPTSTTWCIKQNNINICLNGNFAQRVQLLFMW